MKIWDRGTYELHKFREDEVMATFHGERLRGRYVLFRTRREGLDAPPHGPAPGSRTGSRCRSGCCPCSPASATCRGTRRRRWAYEIKWDGVRALATRRAGGCGWRSRNGADLTPRYPELLSLGRALASHEAIVDGEVVLFDDAGRPSFQKLQGRMHLTSEHAVRRLAASDPVAYLLFDLLWLDGHSLTDLPYLERREQLVALGLQGDRWQTPAHHLGDGAAMLEASRAQGLEGIIAKRRDCPYTPGRRSPHWIKVKNTRSTEVVIGGWLPGEGRRSERFGALVVGSYDQRSGDEPEGRGRSELRYAGRVGTGFDEAELKRLQGILAPLERGTSPFTGRQPPRETHFVEPRLVATVDYGEWTQSRTLRHPVYKGLRDDIDPESVGFDAG